jgi:hypothetical protein
MTSMSMHGLLLTLGIREGRPTELPNGQSILPPQYSTTRTMNSRTRVLMQWCGTDSYGTTKSYRRYSTPKSSRNRPDLVTDKPTSSTDSLYSVATPVPLTLVLMTCGFSSLILNQMKPLWLIIRIQSLSTKIATRPMSWATTFIYSHLTWASTLKAEAPLQDTPTNRAWYQRVNTWSLAAEETMDFTKLWATSHLMT